MEVVAIHDARRADAGPGPGYGDREKPTSVPPTGRPTAWAWAAGVAAGLAGLAVAELGALLLSPLGSPLTAVGQLVIAIAPAGVVNAGKETLGLADKPVLLLVVGAVALAVAGLSGQLEYRRRGAGAVGPFALLVVSLIAVAAEPGVSAAAFPPVVVGAPVAYLLLRMLVGRLLDWRPPEVTAATTALSDGLRRTDRRRFLIGAGTIAAAAVLVGGASRALAHGRSVAARARSMVRLPRPARPAGPVPAEADLGLPGLTPYVTADDAFYRIDTALQVPVVDPAQWRLTITGMVEQEVTMTFPELLALPLTEHFVTLTCVSNEVGGDLAGNARWLGYPVRELLARAKPRPGADMVLSRSVDGFTAGTPLDALTDPDREAIVAVGMNGQPLPTQHGFPARMVVPGLYGYVSATKWLTSLKVTTFAQDHGYWTPLGWSARGPIKLASRIDTPTGSVAAGRVAVAGVAWAQHTGIGTVQVKVDNGPWRAARLADTVGPDTWRQWVYAWDASPGHHQLTVRATDADGRLQIGRPASPAPDGATGYHSVTVTVR